MAKGRDGRRAGKEEGCWREGWCVGGRRRRRVKGGGGVGEGWEEGESGEA